MKYMKSKLLTVLIFVIFNLIPSISTLNAGQDSYRVETITLDFVILEIHFVIFENHFLILENEFLILQNHFLILQKEPIL